MKDIIPTGAHKDTRTPEAKAKDHLHKHYYSGLPVVWVEKSQSQWKLPSQRNQGTSSSCLFQSGATALEVLLKQVVSAAFYVLRADPTRGGSFQGDVGDILKKKGTILEIVCPSQNMSEGEMNSIKLPTFLNIQITGYQFSNPKKIEEIAEAVQAYGNCGLVFDSNHDEWQITPVYTGAILEDSNGEYVFGAFGHSIEAVDFFLLNGVKTILARDSAGQNSSPTGYRLITENFLIHRCRGAMDLLGVKITPIPAPTTPATTSIAPFLVDMSINQTTTEIARLQAFLTKLGFFPTWQPPTGYYGNLTRLAVLAFQQKYVANQSMYAFMSVNGGRGMWCWNLTRNALNKLLI